MKAHPSRRRPLALATAVTLLAGGALAVGTPAVAEDTLVPYTVMFNNFESTVGGNAPRWSALDVEGATAIAAKTANATNDYRNRVSHATSLRVYDRDAAADGAQMPVSGTLLNVGETYTITAWLYVYPDVTLINPANPVTARLKVGSTTLPAASEGSLTIQPGTYTQVAATYTHTAGNTPLSITVGNTIGDFFLEDVMISGMRAGTPVQTDLVLKDELAYPIGAAIEGRSTRAGTPAADLLTTHFDQVAPENAFKPESWYGPDGKFVGTEGAVLQRNANADALMDWAEANDGRVYGHVLLWHSQTPDWFFRGADGQYFTTSPEDQALLKERLREHIFNIAEYMVDGWGEFGSETNGLVGFDVVNEVVADNAATASNGLRTSRWYNTLGEGFIDAAFEYADEAFNDVYAAEGADRPVKLFINEYSTESGDVAGSKLHRYYDLVTRLIGREVPIDGVGHQFHVNLNTNPANLQAALDKFEAMDAGLIQAVTEFDVTTGYPHTERLAIRQGHFYATAFSIFNEFAARTGNLFSVTVWGLGDAGSWLYYSGAPLMFDNYFAPKWALVGAAGGTVPAEPKSMNAFGGSVALDVDATADPAWQYLPLVTISDAAKFTVRWAPDHLSVYVAVTDDTTDATDAVTITLGDATVTLNRDGTGSADGVTAETADGWAAVAHVPATAAQGSTLRLDVAVTDGDVTTGWNAPGVLGEVLLLENLSAIATVEAETPPTIDAVIDDVWAAANTVRTDKVTLGTASAAYADVRTLWSGDGNALYVLAEITDPVISVAPGNAWEKDSFEVFVDAGNAKNGAYLPTDVQIRINVNNEISSGNARVLESATTLTDTGYLVETKIDLLTAGGAQTFHGVDFQVNDAVGNARTGVKAWADPTGNGYQNTSRWGVTQLITGEPVEPVQVFTDVPVTHPFFADISWMADQAIAEGYEDGTFLPAASVSRQAVAAFLYRYADVTDYVAPTEAVFTDVPTTHAFYTEISWLADQGITEGYDDGTFRPGTTVSRQAVAAFLYRYADVTDYEAPTEAAFTDVPTTHAFYTPISWLAEQGITQGYEDGTFRGTGAVARQAMAAFLHRLAGL